MNKNVATGIGVIALLVVIIGVFVYGIPVGILKGGKDNRLAAAAVPFSELARGADAPIDRRVNYLITSAEQFRDLWEMVGGTKPMPDVDFSKDVVMAVFAGAQSTGGYDIVVSNITDADVRTVTVTLKEPGGNCARARTLTAPYQIIKLPATTLKLVHKDVSAVVGCAE